MGKTLVAWLLVASAVAAPAASPREVVQDAVGRVVAALQRADMESDPAPRARNVHRIEIRRVATELFDFDEISRRALSRHWTGRTPEEQAEFVRLFTDLLERSYIGRIESYSGETILYLGETVDGPYATVRSKVVTNRRGETPLDYRLHLRDGRWKVYDVLIDHVSFVSTYRSEFERILRKESYAALIERLRKQSAAAAPAALIRSR
ncbi:MAG TPA: ABC transporter substrate-binding protein [Methylomirabilota bacterium]|jgi:phospholipid transport system substrate-binding protein|nr:ABC transporter substrate-binding protein [Methylomirabilota bacterium]